MGPAFGLLLCGCRLEIHNRLALALFFVFVFVFVFVFNKGPACTGHHLVLGFTNYEAGSAWDLCLSLKLDKD